PQKAKPDGGDDVEKGQGNGVKPEQKVADDNENGAANPFDHQVAAGVALEQAGCAIDAEGKQYNQPANQVLKAHAQYCHHLSSKSNFNSVCERFLLSRISRFSRRQWPLIFLKPWR